MGYREGELKIDRADNGYILSFCTERIEQVTIRDKKGQVERVEDRTRHDSHEELYLTRESLAKRVISLLAEKDKAKRKE